MNAVRTEGTHGVARGNKADKTHKTKVILNCAEYIIKTGATIRSTAEYLGMSKSTVHKYMTQDLKDVDANKFKLVESIIKVNKVDRAHRGGVERAKRIEQRDLSSKENTVVISN